MTNINSNSTKRLSIHECVQFMLSSLQIFAWIIAIQTQHESFDLTNDEDKATSAGICYEYSDESKLKIQFRPWRLDFHFERNISAEVQSVKKITLLYIGMNVSNLQGMEHYLLILSLLQLKIAVEQRCEVCWTTGQLEHLFGFPISGICF